MACGLRPPLPLCTTRVRKASRREKSGWPCGPSAKLVSRGQVAVQSVDSETEMMNHEDHRNRLKTQD